MSELPPIRRRGFQFGLRTMFVVVTLFAASLGWELSFIHQREVARMWLFENGGYIIPEDLSRPIFGSGIPFWRVLMGDESVLIVVLGRDTPQNDRPSFSTLFPEAEVEQTNDVFNSYKR
jgi:hypothetical protein